MTDSAHVLQLCRGRVEAGAAAAVGRRQALAPEKLRLATDLEVDPRADLGLREVEGVAPERGEVAHSSTPAACPGGEGEAEVLPRLGFMIEVGVPGLSPPLAAVTRALRRAVNSLPIASRSRPTLPRSRLEGDEERRAPGRAALSCAAL